MPMMMHTTAGLTAAPRIDAPLDRHAGRGLAWRSILAGLALFWGGVAALLLLG